MAIFTIVYGNDYPLHGKFKLICTWKFARWSWTNFPQQYGRNRQRFQQNTFYYDVWQLLLDFYREFPSKILSMQSDLRIISNWITKMSDNSDLCHGQVDFARNAPYICASKVLHYAASFDMPHRFPRFSTRESLEQLLPDSRHRSQLRVSHRTEFTDLSLSLFLSITETLFVLRPTTGTFVPCGWLREISTWFICKFASVDLQISTASGILHTFQQCLVSFILLLFLLFILWK